MNLKFRLFPLAIGIIMLLATSQLTFIPRVAAEAAKPAHTVGDYWEYESSSSLGGLDREGNTRLTVVGKETLEVGGAGQSVFVLSFDGSGSFYGLYTDMEISGSWTLVGKMYSRESDLYTVKYFQDYELSGTWSNTSGSGSLLISNHHTLTRELISSDWHYPVNVGDEGRDYSKVTSNYSYIMEMGNSDDDQNFTEDETYFENVTFSCLKTERITVPAGDFDAYLNKIQEEDGSYRLKWFSPEVGASVKYKDFDENGDHYAFEKLFSYSYENSPVNFITEILPYILLIIIVPIAAAIIVIILKRRRRKKEYQIPQQYPKQPPI